MTARTRADLESLPGYVPGRSIPGAVKLASNEVSAAPLPSVVAAIRDAAAGVNRYPDNGAAALVGRLAARLDVPPSQLVVGAGRWRCASSWCRPPAGRPMRCSSPGARSRPTRSSPGSPGPGSARCRWARTTPTTWPRCSRRSPRRPGWSSCAIPTTRPAQPCGATSWSRSSTRCPTGCWSFWTRLTTSSSPTPRCPTAWSCYRHRDNLAVLRTFSKAYGLAGLRVGYCAAPEPVATALHKVSVPFSVNSLAQAAALASLDVEDEMLARCRGVAAERDRVRAELLAMGYPVPHSQANFVWLPLG